MFKERLGNFICWVKESSMITIMRTMWASTIINDNKMVLICCTEKEKENHEDIGSRWESCHLLKTNYFYYLWLSIILVMRSVWGCHVRQNVSGKMTVFSCESSLLKIKCLCFSFILVCRHISSAPLADLHAFSILQSRPVRPPLLQVKRGRLKEAFETPNRFCLPERWCNIRLLLY